MNHKKFIQLLNLYIDGEADAAEVREVEHEIETHPARRRIYQDYCRIQAATRTLCAQFHTATDAAQPVVGLDNRASVAGAGQPAAFPGRRPGQPFRRALFWAGGAMAACMAIATAYVSLPRAGVVPHTVQTAETPGLSVPTRPGTAVEIATTAVETGSGSIAAPFAAQPLADPYLVRAGGQGGDPFSLAPVSRQPSFDDREFVLNPVRSIEAATMVPASWPLDPERIAEQNRKLQKILRGRVDDKAQAQQPGLEGAIVPVSLQQQP